VRASSSFAGEAGVGKTALLKSLVETASDLTVVRAVLVRPRGWSIANALGERKKLIAEIRRCGYPAARVLERQRLK
jgi:hypothetical protein